MTLSPAAQAVIDAFKFSATADTCGSLEFRLAAALRAAVGKCKYIDDYGNALLNADEIEAIATELENAS